MAGDTTISKLVAAFLCAAGLTTAQVIPNDFVELDGNSVVNGTACTAPNTPSGCRDDWNLLNGSGGTNPTGSAGGSLARSFVSGAASIAVFTTGGSKDPLDVTSWKWKNGGTPDKDAITNGYAAAYQAPNGHLVLEFGADRFAVNGDANIGFWFFQQNVAPVGTTGGGFSGQHVNNDIFIVSAFTQGGGVSTITVFVWDDSCSKGVNNPAVGDCADSNLRLKFASTPSATCAGLTEGCAIVNASPINVSWPYLTKFGNNSTTIPEGGFYEGGLDVTQLLGSSVGCFTSFLIETRSSQTPSAVLKDFISGSFNVCGVSISKACAGNGVLNAGGTSIHYKFNGTVTNTGIGSLSHVTLVDSLPSGVSNIVFKQGTPAAPPAVPGAATSTVTAGACPSGSPSGATCVDLGTLGAGAVENWTVEFDSSALNVRNDATARGSASNTSPGACTDAATVCSTSSGDSCSTEPTNSITISKHCGVPATYPNAVLPGTQLVTSGGLAAVQVNFSGEVCNTGQTPLSNVTLTDSPAATFSPSTIPTIAPGACVKYSGNYKPSGVTAGDLGGAAGRYSFTDNIKVTGATAGLGTSPGHDATCTGTFLNDAQACNTATCNICPAGATCAGN
jgi:hypothetical protein